METQTNMRPAGAAESLSKLFEEEMAAMAADADIQRENDAIAREFLVAEGDGLS